jgi:hypothetical protein
MRSLSFACALAALLPLFACDDGRRSDLIATSGGDAIAANRAMQIIDPWPRSSSSATQSTRGVRIGATLDRYREGRSTASPDAASTNSAASRTTN